MSDVTKKMKQAAEELHGIFQREFERANGFKPETPKSSTPPPKDNNIRINFTNRRISTFFTFIGCAFEILFSGKTTLVIKKR